MKIGRRRFVVYLLSFFLPLFIRQLPLVFGKNNKIFKKVREVVPLNHSSLKVGRRALRRLPLKEHLQNTIEQLNTLSSSQLQTKITQDFSDDKVVEVDGWLLSATEVKICCYYYLNSPEGSLSCSG